MCFLCFYYLFWVVLGVGLLPGLVVSGKRKSDGFLENIKHQLKVNWMTLQGVNFVFCIYYRAIGIINLKFPNLSPLKSHGIARNRVWTKENNSHLLQSKPINGVSVDLLLKPTEDDLMKWPNSEVEYGFGKLDYVDNTKNMTTFTKTRDTITINSELDRIYLSTPKKLAVLDHKK